ncbi:hypothetical protein POSPLADRAFT_1129832, partial [Postia placenta MAD-698-R-SB12]
CSWGRPGGYALFPHGGTRTRPSPRGSHSHSTDCVPVAESAAATGSLRLQLHGFAPRPRFIPALFFAPKFARKPTISVLHEAPARAYDSALMISTASVHRLLLVRLPFNNVSLRAPAIGTLLIVKSKKLMFNYPNTYFTLFPLEYEKHPGPQPQQFRPRPVPGVSKKGRGRHVPTKEAGGRKGTTYTCSVEDCHKVFKRHEHLKRHVMSLHSNEQNYMCALPFCDKTFNRRDNLLQHERKHTLYQRLFDCTKNFDGELIRNEWEDIKNPDAIYEWPEPWDSGVGIPLSLRYLNLTARDVGDMDEDNVADDDSTMADVGDHPDYTVHFVRYEEPLQPGSPVLVRSDPFAPSDNMFTVFNVSAIHPDDPSASWDDQTIANHELDVPLFDLPSPSNDIKVIPADTVTV